MRSTTPVVMEKLPHVAPAGTEAFETLRAAGLELVTVTVVATAVGPVR